MEDRLYDYPGSSWSRIRKICRPYFSTPLALIPGTSANSAPCRGLASAIACSVLSVKMRNGGTLCRRASASRQARRASARTCAEPLATTTGGRATRFRGAVVAGALRFFFPPCGDRAAARKYFDASLALASQSEVAEQVRKKLGTE